MNSAAKIKTFSFQTFEEDKRGHQLVLTRAKPENQKQTKNQKPLRKQSLIISASEWKENSFKNILSFIICTIIQRS